MARYRVLLFYPEFSIHGIRPLVIPSSTLAIAAAIRATNREVILLDGRIRPPDPSNFDAKPDLVGISSMSAQLKQAIDFAKLVRANLPDVPIVWGNWHATLWPEQVLRSGLGDYVIKGEGGETMVELLDALESGGPVHHLEGLGWRGNGKIHINPDREPSGSFMNLPIPLDLLEQEHYEITDNSLNIFTSMGCPYSCGFCSIERVYHRKWIALPARKIVELVEELHMAKGIEYFLISDANFFVNPKRVREFIDLLLAKRLPVRWSAQGHLSCLFKLDRQDWRKARESGFILGGVGIESGSPKVRKILGKPPSTSGIAKFFGMLHEEGILMKNYFIVGTPGEKLQDFRETVNLIQDIMRHAPDTQMCLSLFTPIPGTRLAEEELSRGRLLEYPNTLEKWAGMVLNAGAPWELTADVMIGYRKRRKFQIISFYVWKIYIHRDWIRSGSGLGIVFRNMLRRVMIWRLKHWVFFVPFEWYLYRLKTLYYSLR